MKKLKLLQIISSLDDGGAQKVVLNYAKDLLKDDQIELNILSLSEKCSILYEEEIKKNNIKIDFLKINKKNLKNYYLNLLYKYCKINIEIKKYIKIHKPDIVHIHLFSSLLFAHNAIKKCKVPLKFYTLHSAPSRFTGKKLKLLQKSFLKEHYIPICVTNEQAEFAKNYYKFGKYEVVHNGVDFKKIDSEKIDRAKARERFGFNMNDLIVCGIGRLDKIKQFDKLIQIFKIVYEKNNNSKLVIAGNGKEMENLKKLSKELQIEDKVVFIGNIKNVVELYCATDVLVVTSKTESASLVLLEAQACNLKCIISNGVPSESIITNKVIKMKENSTVDDWVKAIIDGENYEKKEFDFKDYEVHLMSKKMKEVYLKYYEEYQNGK